MPCHPHPLSLALVPFLSSTLAPRFRATVTTIPNRTRSFKHWRRSRTRETDNNWPLCQIEKGIKPPITSLEVRGPGYLTSLNAKRYKTLTKSKTKLILSDPRITRSPPNEPTSSRDPNWPAIITVGFDPREGSQQRQYRAEFDEIRAPYSCAPRAIVLFFSSSVSRAIATIIISTLIFGIVLRSFEPSK